MKIDIEYIHNKFYSTLYTGNDFEGKDFWSGIYDSKYMFYELPIINIDFNYHINHFLFQFKKDSKSMSINKNNNNFEIYRYKNHYYLIDNNDIISYIFYLNLSKENLNKFKMELSI